MDLTKLRKHRRTLDITLDEVARDTGISVGYLNRIERGFIDKIYDPHKQQILVAYIQKLGRRSPKKVSV